MSNKINVIKKFDIIQSNVMKSYFKNKIKLRVNNNKDINKNKFIKTRSYYLDHKVIFEIEFKNNKNKMF